MALNAILTPFPADFEVWEVRFSDRMNHPFDLFVRGASTAADVDLHALLGHRMTLSLPEEALLSSVHGIVRRAARHAPEPNGVTVYEFHVAPAEWALTRRTNSWIFQKQSVTEIIQTVLGDHRTTTKPAMFVRNLPLRECCVQYDETDHDFVHRLLAEEGIAAYFDQAAGGRWTLIDDTTFQKPAGDRDTIVHENAANLKPGGLAVLRWRLENTVEPITAVRRDHDFTRPQLTLEDVATSASENPTPVELGLEEYVYEPGRLLAATDGKEAARDLEGLRALSQVVHLETNFAAGAGTSLHIEGDELSGDFLIARSEVFLQSAPTPAGGLVNRRTTSASVISRSTPYRPQHRKRPLIFGTQSARVVGDTPEGTVDVDEFGRVNIELRWDRRNLWNRGAAGKGNPTRRVRVVQAWAGPGHGFVTLPRVGDEVIVAYSDGDPDEPLIIGRVHNAVSATPLQLPEADKTKAIWKSQSFGPNGPVEGFNAILMDDAAGAEMLGMRAQRDFGLIVGHNAATFVTADEQTIIGGNQSLTISGNQTIQVGGKRSPVAGGSGGGATTAEVGGNQAVNVTGMYSLAAKGIAIASKDFVTVDSMANMMLTCGADRSDNSHNHYIFADGMVSIHAPLVRLMGETILLQTEKSSISITDHGIKITSSGPVEINGNPVNLNC